MNKQIIINKLLDIADGFDELGYIKEADYVSNKLIVKIAQDMNENDVDIPSVDGDDMGASVVEDKGLNGDDVAVGDKYTQFLKESLEESGMSENILNDPKTDLEEAYEKYFNSDPTEDFENKSKE